MQKNDSLRQQLKGTLHLGRALGLVWRIAPGWTLVGSALLFVQGLLPLAALYLMKLIVDAVTGGLASPDKSGVFHRLALLVGLAGGVAALIALCRALAELITEAQGIVVEDHISEILHAKSVAADLAYYENADYYDALHRAQQHAAFRPSGIVNSLVHIAQNAVALAAVIGLLFTLHWVVAGILFVAVVPGVLARIRYSNRMFRWHRRRTSTDRRTSYIHTLLTHGAYAKEVRLFDLGRLFIEWFRDLRKQLRRERLGITVRRSVAEFLWHLCATAIIFTTYFYIAYRAVHGAITLGDMVMYFGAFQTGLGYLRQLLFSLAGLYEDNLFLSNFYEFVDLKPRIAEPADPKPVPRPMQQGFVFDHVAFRYPASDKKALDDVCLTIGPNQVVALVGENGSGKTTLVKLLCRLYDPDSGSITLDGTPLRELGLADLRRQLGVIFQDYIRYNFTARQNIWLGNIEVAPQDAKIVESAQLSGADRVISRLPRGYETPLGRWLDNGHELSAGEWQKLALARAFLRDAQLIVLDEPASSLDARTEYEVYQKFRELAKGRSALLISHRFSTVRMADYIYVLDEGRIVEHGAHGDLIRLGGRYARLFEMQAQYYK